LKTGRKIFVKEFFLIQTMTLVKRNKTVFL
jgi:hypothetical protein